MLELSPVSSLAAAVDPQKNRTFFYFHMAVTLTSPPVSPSLLRPHPHALSMPSLSHLSRLSIPVLRQQQRRLFSSLAACAVRQESTTWTRTPLARIEPASADASLFHVSIDVSDSPDLAASFTAAGQYVQLRIPSSAKPSFLAIASPPDLATAKGEFEFLVKRIAGSTADALCELRRGEVVEIAGVMGKGFEIGRIDEVETVLMFATGSGISPIRSLIESGFYANKRSDVRLYYGARNLQRMAYQDKFKDWEATGVRIVPVLSQPDDKWDGERGYIQAVFSRNRQISDPLSAGAVLCGHKQMTEDVTSVLVADGVSKDKILKNF